MVEGDYKLIQFDMNELVMQLEIFLYRVINKEGHNILGCKTIKNVTLILLKGSWHPQMWDIFISSQKFSKF